MVSERREGFTLLEIAVAIGVATVVLAGVVMTYSKVSQSARNAARGSDLQNALMGVAQLMEQDFARAGRGISDLNAIEVHYRFVPPPAGRIAQSVPDRSLYPIADLGVTDGFSEIVLQWFDYDLANRAQVANPTFVADFETADGLDPQGDYGGNQVYLLSNKEEGLAGISEGDIFLFYKHWIFTEPDRFNEEVIWNSGVVDEQGNPANGGVILQVGDVSAPEADGSGLGLGFQARVTFSEYDLFATNLAGNENPTLFTPYAFTIPNAVKETLSLPASLYLARKLGDRDSFHRVGYHVETNGGVATLIRTHNGKQEVVATGVTQFEVYIGLDIPPKSPGDVVRGDMDGLVSAMDRTTWTKGFADNPFGNDLQEFKILLGRHAIAAEVRFTQHGLDKDRQSATQGPGNRKVRSFVRQYPIWNNALPMPNL